MTFYEDKAMTFYEDQATTFYEDQAMTFYEDQAMTFHEVQDHSSQRKISKSPEKDNRLLWKEWLN